VGGYDLVESIITKINIDSLSSSEKSLQITESYYELSKKEKESVDDIFISLTGYSLGSLIEWSER